MARKIFWRLADRGDGQPGPLQEVQGPDDEVVATLIPSDTEIQITHNLESGVWENRRTLPAAVDATRTPLRRTSIIGQPNIVPARYYEEGQNELIDPDTHPHIMGVTHRVVAPGNWTDPKIWNTGTVPGAGAVVSLTPGMKTIYDAFSDVILKDLLVPFGATFELATWTRTRIRLDYWMTMGVVNLTDTREADTPGPKHEIIFHASQAPGATTRLGAMFMGPTRIRGAHKSGHRRLGPKIGQAVPSAAAGDTTLYVQNMGGSNWQVGDTIVILGTEYVQPVSSDPQYSGPKSYYGYGQGRKQLHLNSYQFGQDEERTITAIDGEIVTLNAPLQYTHTGMAGTLKNGKAIMVAPVVANVSRSIQFRSASAEEDGVLDPNADITDLQKRAHTMFHRCPDLDVRYFETKNMSRTSTDPSLFVNGYPYQIEMAGGFITMTELLDVAGGTPIANPINVRGRYAVHFHWCGGPYAAAPMTVCKGVSSWAPIGGHPIPGWAMTHHGSRVSMEDCVISNVRGAGMVSELGNETGQWVNNVVTGCRGDGEHSYWGSRSECYTNHNGHAGVAYENQSRAIRMHGNIAGSSRFAYLWHHQKSTRQARLVRAEDIPLFDGILTGGGSHHDTFEDEGIGFNQAQIPPMEHNEAHACRIGFSVFHRAGSESGKSSVPLLVNEFHCLNVPFAFDVSQYSSRYYFKDFLWQGPLNMMASSKAIEVGVVTWDWNFSNGHMRNYRTGFSNSAGLNFDGYVIDVTYENVTIKESSSWMTVSGDHRARDSMGPWVQNPTNPGQWKVRNMESIDSATLPLPYPLAVAPNGTEGFGRHHPAGFPIVKPGEKPYFTLGDGINGAASPGINLTLNGGAGRNQGRVYGIIRDSTGDHPWPSHQSSESFPNQLSLDNKGPRHFGKLKTEQVVQRWGCWNDNGTWKTRVWFPGGDRFTHVRFWFHIDYTLASFDPEFLAIHKMDGPSEEPKWPDLPEQIADVPPPFAPLKEPIRFLSRTRLEAVDGQPLAHRLRPTRVAFSLSIVGGADAALFRTSMQRLQWAGNGVRSHSSPADANGDNVYEVIIRVTDAWGVTHDEPHEVVVIPSERVSPVINDNFNRAAGPLSDTPGYRLLQGNANAITIVNPTVGDSTSGYTAIPVSSNPTPMIDMGSLGTSEQEVSVSFGDWTDGFVIMRMEDKNNWIGFRRQDYAPGTGHGLLLGMMKNGVFTHLGRWAGPGSTRVFFRAEGRRITCGRYEGVGELVCYYPQTRPGLTYLEHDPKSRAGAVLLPADAPMGTHVGLRGVPSGGVTRSRWIDNFEAKALPS